MKGKVFRREGVVWSSGLAARRGIEDHGGDHRVSPTRRKLIANPTIGSGLEVTARARDAVAADGLVPEQGFAQHDGSLSIGDDWVGSVNKTGDGRRRDALERDRLGTKMRPGRRQNEQGHSQHRPRSHRELISRMTRPLPLNSALGLVL